MADPYFDLIVNADLAENKYPKDLEAVQAGDGHKCLMAQVLTKELWEKLKNHKTASAGWTLARAINTGTCYPTSFVGCHAGDLESYTDYKELFYPVIEMYHKGYKTDGSMKHVTDMDVSKITTNLESNSQAKIISTRIRCARNLKMFPLNPGGTKQTRLDIADMMEKVFATLEGDLAGTFYRHTSMTPEQTKSLVDRHFLFRGKDKMQAASGYHADWPHGRGIFVSNDEKFLLWINEGDHIRIISMEQGGDVKSVFSRLSRGVAAIEAGLQKVNGRDDVYMHDEILGKIACCPSNLGTCMRGSVHILVPKLIAKIGFDEIDKIARGMSCQARGSSGEHSEVVDRIDVSNWRRLGFPEYELVQDMIKCANRLAEMEDAIPDPYFDLIMNADLAENKYPKDLEAVQAGDGHKSLMAQAMTKQLWEKLKNHKTASAGWTLARAINTGTCYPTSFVGCHAGDLESYTDYKELFYPVIEMYHKGYKTDGSMKHVTDMDVSKITTNLESNSQAKIISTRIRCARNLKMFPLNPGGTKQTRLDIADMMEKVFATLEGDLAGTFYRHTSMTPEQTKSLVDRHFLFRGKDKMQAASGYHADWPHGRGIFVSNDEKFLLWINEGDHIRIISMEQGGDVKSVFSRLSRGVAAIEAGLQKVNGRDDVYMHDEILGKIACCPSNLGTCMRGSVHILVPKLIAKIGFDEIDKIARGMSCQARGSSGEHSEVVDRIDVSNWRRLGFPEYELVQDMIKCANRLAEMEDEC